MIHNSTHNLENVNISLFVTQAIIQYDFRTLGLKSYAHFMIL